MSGIDPAADDPIFDDEYQRARRRRMLAAGLTVKPGPTRADGTRVHDCHVGTGITPKDATVEPPEPRAAEERPRGHLIRDSGINLNEVTRLQRRAGHQVRRGSRRLEVAVAFLKRELAAGPTPARVIYERAARAGLSERTIDRAKREAQIASKRLKADRGMQWFWHLPGMEPSSLDRCVH